MGVWISNKVLIIINRSLFNGEYYIKLYHQNKNILPLFSLSSSKKINYPYYLTGNITNNFNYILSSSEHRLIIDICNTFMFNHGCIIKSNNRISAEILIV